MGGCSVNAETRFAFVPVYRDWYQSDDYQLAGYTVEQGRPMAHFASGSTVPSVEYLTEAALVAACSPEMPWYERLRRVSPESPRSRD